VLEKLDKKGFNDDILINNVSRRIMQMKLNDRSDVEINHMINGIKQSHGGISKKIRNMPLFSESNKHTQHMTKPKTQRILEEMEIKDDKP